VVNALPAVVKESFQYVLPALYGSLIIMQILNNPKAAVKYMPPAFVLFFLLDKIPQVAYFAMALNMLIIVVYAYFLNKYESKKTGTTAS
jgi:branched-subunit amino acid transport protein